MKLAALHDVRLGDGPFAHAQNLNAAYLSALDPERLLAPFRAEAGLARRVDNYGNWESQGLDGHTAGHYLSAVSMMWASTGRPEFRRMAAQIVTGLAECQSAGGTGYVGGVPQSAELWAQVSEGRLNSSNFSLEGRWVPWYNLHKTFAGLIDAFRHAKIDEAIAVVIRLADWWLGLAQGIDETAFEAMLATEFGGMNESFADLAAITGRGEYLEMARRFAHRSILEPLIAMRDELAGLHANTQIPKVLGYQRVASVGGDLEAGAAAQFFWSTVVDRHSVAIGGHGVREHFHDADDFSSVMRDREGPESCNTYNMVRLSGMLFEATDEGRYIDYAERALFNHVLSAQHPGHGGFVYFTPQRPGHYRVYSVAEQDFWCCVGTGMEANARHGALAYAIEADILAVELFIDSTVEWPAIAGRLRQKTRFPFTPHTQLEIQTASPAPSRATLRLRVPSWLSGSPVVTVNGARIDPCILNGRIEIDREWRDGDVVDYELPMAPRLERLPDGSAWGAVMYGPVVLAAAVEEDKPTEFLADGGRAGHIARGALRQFADLPIIPGKLSSIGLEILDRGTLRFALDSDRGRIVLSPFSELHDSRYQLYWPLDDGDPVTRRNALWSEDEWSLGLDARTIDAITLGEQQPEVDHRWRGEGSERGRDAGDTWRRTSALMEFEFTDWQNAATCLRLELIPDPGADYEVTINGSAIATVIREHGEKHPDSNERLSVDIPIPPRADTDRILVGFVPRSGATTDRLCRLRLLSG